MSLSGRACRTLLIAAMLLPAACATTPAPRDAGASAADNTQAAARPADARPIEFRLAVQPDDRVLFIGDDVTQHGFFYTRAVATALISIEPRYNLRFFNGGRQGATAASANAWADELIVLTRPTVVYICLGFNDGKGEPPEAELIEKYKRSLGELIDRALGYKHVRLVVVLSPPATQKAVATQQDVFGENVRLRRLSRAASEVARAKKVAFIDLFDYMLAVYVEAMRVGGSPLTIGHDLPTEEAQVLMASAILYAIGVRPRDIDPVGFSPMIPRKMGRVRAAMAVGNKPVLDLTMAQTSRTLYEHMRRHDEAFFRAWRLADRPQSPQTRGELMTEADSVWSEILAIAVRVYGGAKPVASPADGPAGTGDGPVSRGR